MPSDEAVKAAKQYNDSVDVCFCHLVPERKESCFNCQTLADLLDEMMAQARLEEARLVEGQFLDQGGWELVNRSDWLLHLAELERLAGRGK